MTRRGNGDTRGPAEPGTPHRAPHKQGWGLKPTRGHCWAGGPGEGGAGTPWGRPQAQAGGGPQLSPSYVGRGSLAGSGAQPHLPHVHPPQPLTLILPPPHVHQRQRRSTDTSPLWCPPDPDPVPGTGLAPPWLGIAPFPARGLRGSPPRCPYPTGLCRQEQPYTPRPLQAVFGDTAALGATRTPVRGGPAGVPSRRDAGHREWGHAGVPGSCRRLSASVQLGSAEAAPRISPGCSGQGNPSRQSR